MSDRSRRKRIAVILTDDRKTAKLQSVRRIIRNFQAAYKDHPFENSEVGFVHWPSAGRQRSCAAAQKRALGRMTSFRPDVLAFPAFRPRAFELLHALNGKAQLLKDIRLIFHIDPTSIFSAPSEWLRAESILVGLDCRFVCASPRFAKFIGSMLRTGTRSAPWLPNPTNTTIFRPSTRHRTVLRQKLGCDENTFLVVSTGRIGRTKHSAQLGDVCAKLKDKGIKLVLAAHRGEYPRTASTNDSASEEAEQLKRIRRTRTKIIWDASETEIAKLLNASDAFASLSTYPYEDFGMSAAEALACKIPAILTDWGGYAQHKQSPGTVRFVPVTGKGIDWAPDLEAFRRHLILMQPMAKKNRRPQSDIAMSISKVSERLARICLSSKVVRFKGFTNELHHMVMHHLTSHNAAIESALCEIMGARE